MKAFGSLFMTLLVVSLSHGLPIDQDQQSDASVRGLPARLEAKINAIEVKIKQMEDTSTGSLQGKAALSSETPAFMAALSNHYDHCAKNQPVVFDAVDLNQGGGYDNRHGLFRAPKTGTYQISLTLSVKPSLQGYRVGIVKNSVANNVGYLFADARQTLWEIHSTSIIIRMNAGDDVWISCVTDSSIHGDRWPNYRGPYHSHFSGFIISQD